MSYPRELRVLVVEDDPTARSFYSEAFDQLKKEGLPIAPIRFAHCHDDAREALDSDDIFHVVFLDLRIPSMPLQPASEDLNIGISLLDTCIARHDYPIPVLVIASAHLGDVNQVELAERVRSGFACGYVIIKGIRLPQEIRQALNAALAYCDIGIHIQDAGSEPFPTLSPREDDLLRRAVLSQESAVGIDLEWWSATAEVDFSTNLRSQTTWTKILSGRFLLRAPLGYSRRTFFKLTSQGGSASVISDAKLMEQKLLHIKVCAAISSGARSLLATQKVGDVDSRPLSLDGFLSLTDDKRTGEIPKIVEQIVTQVASLGALHGTEGSIRNLLWTHHNRTTIATEWDRWGGQSHTQRDPRCDALAMLDRLQAESRSIRFYRQDVLHGDLNATNIAIDLKKDSADGYIFDASGARAGGVNIRDLAMLEVTTLLHREREPQPSIVCECQQLYDTRWSLDAANDSVNSVSQAIGNVIRFIAELRRSAILKSSELVYALMVFDATLIQVGGLAFSVSRNKIADPKQAVELAAFAARWLSTIIERESVD